jgi:hypothetical protein
VLEIPAAFARERRVCHTVGIRRRFDTSGRRS